jgi:hypothetical protein
MPLFLDNQRALPVRRVHIRMRLVHRSVKIVDLEPTVQHQLLSVQFAQLGSILQFPDSLFAAPVQQASIQIVPDHHRVKLVDLAPTVQHQLHFAQVAPLGSILHPQDNLIAALAYLASMQTTLDPPLVKLVDLAPTVQHQFPFAQAVQLDPSHRPLDNQFVVLVHQVSIQIAPDHHLAKFVLQATIPLEVHRVLHVIQDSLQVLTVNPFALNAHLGLTRPNQVQHRALYAAPEVSQMSALNAILAKQGDSQAQQEDLYALFALLAAHLLLDPQSVVYVRKGDSVL